MNLSNEWFNAAQDGNDKRMAELLALQPSLIELEDSDEDIALDYAASGGHEKVVALLLAARPDLIHSRNSKHYWNALHCARAKEHPKMVAQLELARNDAWGQIRDGLRAIAFEHDETLQQIFDGSGPFDVSPIYFYLAKQGLEKAFTQLLTVCPWTIDVVGTIGSTVLQQAADAGRDNFVTQILALRPDMISVVDDFGWNALMSAVSGGHQSVAERLLAIKPDLIFQVSTSGARCRTVLHVAVENCSACPQFVAKLWRMNPQALTLPDSESKTPFYYAVCLEKDELVELFQWGLSFDDIVTLSTQKDVSYYEERFRLVMEQQCELLFECLSQDVVGVVFEFIGFAPIRRVGTWTQDAFFLHLDFSDTL